MPKALWQTLWLKGSGAKLYLCLALKPANSTYFGLFKERDALHPKPETLKPLNL